MEQDKLQLFEDQPIRTAWDEAAEEWYFSVVDVVRVLTETDNPRRYWSDLKRKMSAEGSELYEKIVQLKLKSTDGKRRATDVANTEQLLRIIQSIPSPKAEPFKLWLARVEHPQGLEENRDVSHRGGSIAGNARREIEAQTGRPVITAKNAAELGTVVTQMIESAPENKDTEEE